VRDIYISGATLAASGADGAGIGSGKTYHGAATVQSITLEGCGITATGQQAAAIGSGSGDSGTATVGSITIRNCDIVASVISGAGIGTGVSETPRLGIRADGGADVRITTLTIEGTTAQITSRNSAGIGGGSGAPDRAALDTLSIGSSTFTVSAPIAVGSTSDAVVNTFRLSGQAGSTVAFDCSTSGSPPLIIPTSSDLERVTLVVATNSPRVFSGSEAVAVSFDFVGLYRGASQPEPIASSSIHVGGMTHVDAGNYSLTFREKSSAPSSWKSIPFTSEFRGFTVTVPPGEYEIWWTAVETGNEGRVTSGSSTSITVGSGEASWSESQVNPGSSSGQGGARSSAGLSGGAVAGIVIGAVIGILGVVALVLILRQPANVGTGRYQTQEANA
jgi:hypothetical protein